MASVTTVNARDTAPAMSALLLSVGGAAVAAGRALIANISTAGNMVVTLEDGSTMTLGLNATTLYEWNWSVVGVVSYSGAGTFYNLY